MRAPLSHSPDAWFALLGRWVKSRDRGGNPAHEASDLWLSQGVNSIFHREETMRALLLGLLLAVMTAVPVFADDDGGDALPQSTTIEAAL
jgi:hypothetical protein